MPRLKFIFGLTIFFIPLFSRAESLDAIALRILTGSPEYQSEIYSLESLRRNLATDANLPDPELGGEYLAAPPDESNRWAAELSWGLEWPGVYGARKREADVKSEAASKKINTLRAERLAEIKDLLLDYVRSRKKLELLEELSRNNDTIYRLAEDAARGGEMTVLDLNKIRLEYANIRVAMAALTDEKLDVEANISKIYGRDCRDLLENMDCEFPELLLPSEEELSSIKDKAPGVEAAMAEARAAEATGKVARMEALPSISFGYKHAYEDGMHFNGGLLGISLPIFSSRGKQKAAQADIHAAEFQAEAIGSEAESEARATYRRLLTIKSQIDEIAPIVENSDYNAALLKAYKGGVITLIEYISDRNYFTNAAVELVSLRHNAAKAVAFLQRFLNN